MTPSSTDTPIRFKSADEFMCRHNWRAPLDHQAHRLSRIIGDYAFAKAQELPCGLAGCRQIHQHGFVVATADGLETHIGNLCGKRHFPDQWSDLHSRYRQAADDRDRRQWVADTLATREAQLRTAISLRDSLSEHDRMLSALWASAAREPALAEALRRIHRDGGDIRIERHVDRETAERMNLAASQRHRFETVGRLEGIEALVPDQRTERTATRNALSYLTGGAIPLLKALAGVTLAEIPPRQYKHIEAQLRKASEDIGVARGALETVQRFQAPANLAQFARLEIPKATTRAKKIIDRLSRGEP